MKLSLLALVLGFGLNLLVKKPGWIDLPIHLMGKFILLLEKVFNDGNPEAKKRVRDPRREYLWGIVMAVLVTVICTGAVKLLLVLTGMIHPLVSFVLEIIMCWQLLTVRSVHDAAIDVYENLQKAEVELSKEAETAKKTVRLIAEDTVSGGIAPMFYMMLGGAALGFFYTAIYMMDKMVGHQTERYCYFGMFAVKLKEMVCYIPAKLAAVFVLMAVSVLKLDKRNAWKVYRRDRKKQKSRKGSYMESVISGAFHIQLADTIWDSEDAFESQLFEEDGRPLKPTDILRVNRLMYYSVTIALVLFVIIKVLIIFVL